MRRDLEEWLKGKAEFLKELESTGRPAGLPVVRPSPSPARAPFKLIPQGSMALLPRKAPPPEKDPLVDIPFSTGDRDDGQVPRAEPEEAPSVSAPSRAEAAEEVVRPGPRQEEGPAPSPNWRAPDAPARDEMKNPPLPSEQTEDGAAETIEVSGDGAPDPVEETPEPVPPLPRRTVERGVPSGSDAPPEADSRPASLKSEVERDARLTERLRRVTQMRRAATEAASRAEVPQHRTRLVALCVVAVLVLGTIFALYRHIQNNSQGAIAREAQKLYDGGNYSEAAELYQKGFDRYPDSLSFLLGLARSSERAGQSEQALKTWRLYLSQVPEEEKAIRAQALYEIGRLYALMRAPDKAIEHLLQSSNLDSTHYDTHFVLGRLLEERNRSVEALNAYRHALDVRPSSQEALDAVKRVAGLLAPTPPQDSRDPAREYAKHLEVGTVALNLKRYDEALSCFNRALAIRSDDERPWLGVAGAHQGGGKDAEALKILQDAQKHIPDSVTIKAKIDELEARQKKNPPASPAKRKKTPSSKTKKS